MLPSHPIARLLLADLDAAAHYLDDLADDAGSVPNPGDAHRHAVRLWAAVQVVERLVVGIETLIVPPDREVPELRRE
jgi:hypothetical protein